MAKTSFQAKITLNGAYAVDGENKMWACDVTFTDSDGAYQGVDVHIGDVVAFDTSVVETGTFSFYSVDSIQTQDYTVVSFTLKYMDINDNTNGPPDLGWVIGQDGTIARPSSNIGLLPVVSRDYQVINDKFTEYVQNYNFTKILDAVTPKNTIIKTNGDATAITQAQLVYINETTDTQAHAASASVYAKSRVAGLAVTPSVASGGQVIIQFDDEFNAPTEVWDALTGDTGGLKAGKEYFLSSTILGGLSNTPDMNAASVTKIGKALSSTAIALNIEPPIML